METEKMFKSDSSVSGQLLPLGSCSLGETSQEAALRGWILWKPLPREQCSQLQAAKETSELDNEALGASAQAGMCVGKLCNSLVFNGTKELLE